MALYSLPCGPTLVTELECQEEVYKTIRKYVLYIAFPQPQKTCFVVIYSTDGIICPSNKLKATTLQS
uniref:Uncharacterized protein n=1 Tax=Anguilla anguilla TaxID=7936 RepID=A0A0E9Q8H5_ANGAN